MPPVTARYDRHALRYARWWGPVIEPTALALLDWVGEALRDRPPAAVLDVGTGTGVLARAAVQRWPEASVIGLDGSAGMLGVARAEAEARLTDQQRSRLGWQAALAERLPFADGRFDVVISSFVYQLVPDRLAALREAHRVLVPGGMLAYVTWLAADDDFEPQRIFDELVEEDGLDESLEEEDARSGDIASTGAAAAQLRRAGFREVSVRAGWLEHRWTAGSYVRLLERYEAADLFATLDRPTRAKLRTRVAERYAVLRPDAFAWRVPVVSALAWRPAVDDERRPGGSRGATGR